MVGSQEKRRRNKRMSRKGSRRQQQQQQHHETLYSLDGDNLDIYTPQGQGHFVVQQPSGRSRNSRRKSAAAAAAANSYGGVKLEDGSGNMDYGHHSHHHHHHHQQVDLDDECEVGDQNSHGDIILVPNSMLKQEILEDGEVVVGAPGMHAPSVGNEIVIEDPAGRHVMSGVGLVLHHDDEEEEEEEEEEEDDDEEGDGTANTSGFESSPLVIDTDAVEVGGSGLEGDGDVDQEEQHTVGYDCGMCGAILRSRGSLKKHISKHHRNRSDPEKFADRVYICQHCPYTTQRRDKLDKHMSKHAADGVTPLGRKRVKATPPVRMRHAAEEYRCSVCPYKCTVEKAYRKHQKLHQASTKQQYVVKVSISSEQVSCQICGKDRSTEADLRKHMRKHRDDKDFICDICGFASVQLKKIIQHRRMHTGEKPHLCPHCTYRSARRDNLRSHVRRMHKKENMYIDTFNPRIDFLGGSVE